MRHKLLINILGASLVIALPAPQNAGSGPNLITFAVGGLAGLFGGATRGVPYGPVPSGCSQHEILVARGTGEGGSFGVIVGDALVHGVVNAVPGTRGYPVQYPANFNLSYSPNVGVDDAINRLNKQHRACPQQDFALVGYSQGAGVMHGVLGPTGPPYSGGPAERPKLDEAVLPKIKALVMFGDPGFRGTVGPKGTLVPKFSSAMTARLRQNCAQKDLVCDPSGGSFDNHLRYIMDPYQKDSIAFLAAAFKGQPLPKAPKSPADEPEKFTPGVSTPYPLA